MSLPIQRLVPDRHAFPHVDLGTFPTPVQRHDELGEYLDIPDLYVKHDGQTGDVYGGNKVRKLEFLLGDAKERGCTTVWTGGGIGSNHALATSLYAREQSLRPRIVHFPQPVTDHVLENLSVLSTTDPYLKLVPGEMRAAVEAARLRVAGWVHPNPSSYYVPPGGASPVGELGYVNAALELKSQIEAGELPEPDVVFVAVGTGGTLAGLLVGCRLASLDCSVVGVRVGPRLLANSFRIARLANQTSSLLAEHGVDAPGRISARDVTILGDYVGEGYGVETAEARQVREFAADSGLELEGTFTSKTVAALAGERGRLALDQETVLYLHTYNEVDLAERAAAATPLEDLPPSYHRFFDAAAE